MGLCLDELWRSGPQLLGRSRVKNSFVWSLAPEAAGDNCNFKKM